MIELSNSIWSICGLGVGMLHASMLWRGMHRPTPWTPLWGLLRLALVAGFLVLAALSGAILATAGGWLLGLLSTVGWLLASRLRPTPPEGES